MLTARQISNVSRMQAQCGQRQGSCFGSFVVAQHTTASTKRVTNGVSHGVSVTIRVVLARHVETGEECLQALVNGQKRLPNGWRQVRKNASKSKM